MIDVAATLVRHGQPADRDQLACLRHALWPESSVEEHGLELTLMLAGKFPGALPQIVVVAEATDQLLVGFIEVGLRSYADGCDPAAPVGYAEGWFVSPEYRRKGVGTELMAAAQDWARAQGCVEMASDTQFDNELSQRVHEALGFEIVDRCVHYRKTLLKKSEWSRT